MGEFWDSVKGEAARVGGGDSFGADYNSNPTVVRQVQAAINAMGYSPPLTVDGAFGPMTRAGVVWAQGARGLTADGVIGDQTLGALGISPPGGISVQSGVGAVKGGVAAVSAGAQQLMDEFAPLLQWAQSPSNHQPITQGSGVAPGFQATRASVVNSYTDWTTPLEGWVGWMYIDALGYVTTGMGNKIDSIGEAQALPWVHTSGAPASAGEIAAAWQAVDSHRTAAKGQKQPGVPGGGAQSGWSDLRLTKQAIQQLVARKLRANEDYLVANLPGFPQAPADAQMAVHSMSWAMGPGNFSPSAGRNYFKSFTEAFNAGDYQTAADNSHMGGVGIDMRNMANKLLLTNAALVANKGFNRDYLFYLNFPSLFQPQNPLGILASMARNKKRTLALVGIVTAFVGALVWLVLGRKHGHAQLPPWGGQ